MRTLVLIITTLVSLTITDITVFFSIAGALFSGIIAFILPPLFYNKQFSSTISPVKKWANYLIVLFGVVASIASIV